MKILCSLALFLLAYLSQAQELVIEKIPNLFFNSPVDIASTSIVGDSRLFVLEKNGLIRIVEDPEDLSPVILSTPFLDLTNVVNPGFEGGLLGLAFHPNFEVNGYFFVNYTFSDPNNNGQFSTKISRFSLDNLNPNRADLSSEMEIITIPQPKQNHNGGDIAFGADGYLYIPLGDGGGAGDEFKTAQDRQSLLGKVLRIDIDTEPYKIPDDNPFAFDDQTLDEIWSLGWRNPWKVSFDRETGDFWLADVGQNAIEELDFEPAGSPGGLNYGWNCFEGTQEYDDELCEGGINHTEPIFQYDQSQGWKSITGGYVYRGDKYLDLVGHYIFTDYEDSRVFWLTEQISENEFDTQMFSFSSSVAPSKVATFGEASNGELYFATLINGELWKIGTNYSVNTENIDAKQVDIFPNPVSNLLEIRTDKKIGNHFVIYNAEGKQVLELYQDSNKLNVNSLLSGLYILQFTHDGEMLQKQFVKE